MTITRITGGTLITPSQNLPDHDLIIENGLIAAIRPTQSQQADEIIDASGHYVIPGFIDVHVHGGAGADTMDATPEALHTMGRFFAAHGVTAYYPTTVTDSPERTLAALDNIAAAPQPEDGARHLGAHVEGPYLNAEHKGAQPAEFLRAADPAEYEAWLATGVTKLITVAPEIDGVNAMIARLMRDGVEFAIGHSGADYAIMQSAADAGVRQVTHTFNGMRGLHHREPGTLGAALTDDRLYAQIIPDGIHVHPAMVKLLVRAKTPARTLLITDSMRATGLHDGTYTLGAEQITVKDGIARTIAGNLAGSTLTMDAGLRNIINFTGLSLAEALPMATAIPAEAMGLTGRKGTLTPGADADIVLLDSALHPRLTLIAGRVIYRAET